MFLHWATRYQKWSVSMRTSYLFDSCIAGWFSNSFHKRLLNPGCAPGSVLHVPVGTEGLLPCNLFTRHPKEQTWLLQIHPDTLSCRVQPCMSFFGGIITTQKLTLFSKHGCVSKHRPLVERLQLGASVPRRGSSEASPASHEHSCQGWLPFHGAVYAK